MSVKISPIEAYKFCPKCAGNFCRQGRNLLKCSVCNHDFFVNQAPAAGAVICNDKNEVLLVKRKFDPNKGTWQIPGGFLELGETYEQALVREIQEELRVKIIVEKFILSQSEDYFYSGVHMPILCFFSSAKIISGEITPSDDVAEAKFFKAEDLSNLNFNHGDQKYWLKEFIDCR